MKICPVEDELLHADGRKHGQTGVTTLIVAFHNFSKAPVKDKLRHYIQLLLHVA